MGDAGVDKGAWYRPRGCEAVPRLFPVVTTQK
jgi:hypothetical protein